MDIDLNTWGVIGTWASGFATVAAVYMALQWQRRFERSNRPKLEITYEMEAGGHIRYLPPHLACSAPDAQKREELWIKLCVENKSETAAQDVELRLVSIQKEDVPENRPMWWFKASNLDLVSVKMLPRGFHHYFDIAYLKNLEGSAEDISCHLMIVSPDLSPWAKEKKRIELDDNNNKLEIGRSYNLRLAVVSSNADAKYYSLQLKINQRRYADPRPNLIQGEKILRERLVVGDLLEEDIGSF